VNVKNEVQIITLKAKFSFFVSVFSFIMLLALIIHMPYHNMWAYSFMVIYGIANLIFLKITSQIYEINQNEFIIYSFFGLLGKKHYLLNNLKEFQYTENNNGNISNFILIFPNKKIEILSFFSNMSQAFTYLRFHYPDLDLKKVKF
jgi:hypothetical protein